MLHHDVQNYPRAPAMSTRMLIFLALVCGLVILVAFAVQVVIA